MKLILALSAQKIGQKAGQAHVQLSVHFTLFAEDEFWRPQISFPSSLCKKINSRAMWENWVRQNGANHQGLKRLQEIQQHRVTF